MSEELQMRRTYVKDTNKTYSLHEQRVYVITKGKEHKAYEFGIKTSIATAYGSNIIIGVVALDCNDHDSKTLDAALTSANVNRDKLIIEAVCDRGYRGKKEVLGTSISVCGTVLKRDTEYQKEKKHRMFMRSSD